MKTERLVYLSRLGAKTPRAPKPLERPAPPPPPVSVKDLEGPPAPQKKRGPAPPPRLVQGEPRRTRFIYAKVGPMAYLSHLDLIRALPRSFRRADIPLYYSSGFHPKPDMTFSPALSLGIASLAEVLDVKLTIDADPEEVAKALTRVSPRGLVFQHGVALQKEDVGLAKVIDSARYAVGIPRRAVSEERLVQEVLRVLATPEIRIIRKFDRGLAKAVDVKRFLRGLLPLDSRASTFLEEARVAGDLIPLLVDVSVTGEGGVKISEVMTALFGDDAVPYHAVRAELGRLDGDRIVSPAEVELLRVAPPELIASA